MVLKRDAQRNFHVGMQMYGHFSTRYDNLIGEGGMHKPRPLCLRSTQYVAISPPRLLHIRIVRRKRHK